MKILICGLPGSGKTWLAERLTKISRIVHGTMLILLENSPMIGISVWRVELDKLTE